MISNVNIGSLIASLGIDMDEFEKGIKQVKKDMKSAEDTISEGTAKAGRDFKKLGKDVQKAGKKIKQVGKDMTMYVTAPIIALGVAAVKMEMDFEFALTKMISLVGVSRQQVNAWRDDILDLASAVGKSPQELAKAMYFITSAGLRGSEAMDVLKASAKASAAGLGEVKLVADNVTSAMNAYKDTNLGAAEATDVLINAVRLGKVEAEDMATAMGHVFPIASKLGVSFDQIAAGVASLTRTGTPAETAAVQLRQALGQLIGPSKEAKTALRDLNWSATEFRKSIRDDGLFKALETFTNKVDEFGDIEIAKKVFGNIRALTGIFDIMGGNIEHNRMIFDEMTRSLGRTDKAFSIVSMTLKQKWNIVTSTMQATLITIGKELKTILIPILVSLTAKLRDLIDWIKNLSDGAKKTIAIIIGIVAALGPLLIGLGALTQVVGFVIKNLNTLRLAFLSMSATVSWVLIGLAALAAAYLAVKAAIKHFETGQQKAEKAMKKVRAEYSKQVAESKLLFDELKALKEQNDLSNVQKKRQSDLLSKVNGKYAEYLDIVISDETSQKDLATAMEKVNKALRTNNILRSFESKIQKEQARLAELQSEAYVNALTRLREYGIKTPAAVNIATEAMKGHSDEISKMLEKYAEVEDFSIWKRMSSEWTNLDMGVQATARSIGKVIKKSKEFQAAWNSYQKAEFAGLGIDSGVAEELKNLEEKYTDINTKIAETIKLIQTSDDEFGNLAANLKSKLIPLQDELSVVKEKMDYYISTFGSVPSFLRKEFDSVTKAIEDDMKRLREALADPNILTPTINLWQKQLGDLKNQVSDLLAAGVDMSDSRIVKLVADAVALQKLIDGLKKKMSTLFGDGKKDKKLDIEIDKTKIEDAFKSVEDTASATMKVFGKEIDVTAEKLKILENFLEKVLDPDYKGNFEESIKALGNAFDGLKKPLTEVEEIFKNYRREMEKNKVQVSLLGDSFNLLDADVSDTKSTIDNLFNSFDSLTEDQRQRLKELIKKWEELTGKIYKNKEALLRQKEAMESQVAVGEILAKSFGRLAESMITAMVTPLKEGEDFGKRMMGVIGAFLQDLGAALMAAALATEAFKDTLLANPLVALAAGAAAVALGAHFVAIANAGPQEGQSLRAVNVPEYADGGLAYGPTIGKIGEYPGARSNPEVVAPLDKLKAMIGGGSYGNWETANVSIPADKLDITLKRYRNKQNSFR